MLQTQQLVNQNIRWNSSAAAPVVDDLLDDEHGQEEPLDAFRTLHLDRKFDISAEELKHSYRKLMTTLHPDKHHGKPPEEQEYLLEQASQVTQSYQLLKDIPTRATHLLQLLGRVNGDTKQCDSKKDTNTIVLIEESSLRDIIGEQQSMLVLMEIMELREAIDEAETDAELKVLLDENTVRMDDFYQQLSKAFLEYTTATTGAGADAGVHEGDSEPNLDKALECTVMLQYYSRIDETIRDKME